jgi:hypothetical protein
MTKWYALEVKKSDLPLLKFLQDGFHPKPPAGKYFLVFGVEENGKEITTRLMRQRDMFNDFDMPKRTPFLIALKERKS